MPTSAHIKKILRSAHICYSLKWLQLQGHCKNLILILKCYLLTLFSSATPSKTATPFSAPGEKWAKCKSMKYVKGEVLGPPAIYSCLGTGKIRVKRRKRSVWTNTYSIKHYHWPTFSDYSVVWCSKCWSPCMIHVPLSICAYLQSFVKIIFCTSWGANTSIKSSSVIVCF